MSIFEEYGAFDYKIFLSQGQLCKAKLMDHEI